jgi:hypothetical protein
MDPSSNDKSASLVDQYRRSFALYGDTPAGVQWPRGRQEIRFAALTRHITCDGFSLLDFGCGLAHLKPYLDQRFARYQYRGADLVPEFVDAIARKFPDAAVQRIDSFLDLVDEVDHVVISGTFNIIEGGDRDAHMANVKATLCHLFSLAKRSLSVNFMKDSVDFMQDSAFHVNLGQMAEFMQEKLSPRIVIDSSYMPYEFTFTAIKDAEIIRPDNIYRAVE